MSTRLYSLAELYMHGKDKEVFEAVHSPFKQFEGRKYVIKQTKAGGKIIKREGSYDDCTLESIAVHSGAFTATRFKKVDAYKKITLSDALSRIEAGDTVYLGDSKKAIERFTDFEDTALMDFDDLFNFDFFIKS
ncbi:hypothetical protein ABEY65_28095 [Priestia aryabhattai]|uniref:hypothetical protein n=1 Tax=Priestia aryabhattai TaxID=412384 RepID=UPI003D2B4ADC